MLCAYFERDMVSIEFDDDDDDDDDGQVIILRDR
jgi:hypothetical protein